ncbi:hypothetical protein PN36_12950 [Candidatus Thiomargarita nelsonii]|uniref:DUF4129 domain-containing protein n=1 Tax=Candidatus Thiomargarita nelsonii TaxID=1003181 RepID=A0A0A6PEP5_9GAMM|nr:hypothetical protein PN36_12950 [Candidatus Thiomargarita nelsonii]
MELDKIEAVVRPRNPWESIDLGFSMVQRWWKPLYKVWFAIALPLFLSLHLFFYFFYESLWMATLMIWWLKPFLDRILLHFFSQALFGEHPSIWQTLKASLFKTRLLLALSLGRFDFARSFNLPVLQLEGGKRATERIKLLQKNNTQAVWLTIVCMHFEGILLISVIGLLYFMMPLSYSADFYALEGLWLEIMNMIFYFLVLSIVEPLYVAGGFALYLNRRTHLEAWDIYLAFRRIAAHSK